MTGVEVCSHCVCLVRCLNFCQSFLGEVTLSFMAKLAQSFYALAFTDRVNVVKS